MKKLYFYTILFSIFIFIWVGSNQPQRMILICKEKNCVYTEFNLLNNEMTKESFSISSNTQITIFPYCNHVTIRRHGFHQNELNNICPNKNALEYGIMLFSDNQTYRIFDLEKSYETQNKRIQKIEKLKLSNIQNFVIEKGNASNPIGALLFILFIESIFFFLAAKSKPKKENKKTISIPKSKTKLWLRRIFTVYGILGYPLYLLLSINFSHRWRFGLISHWDDIKRENYPIESSCLYFSYLLVIIALTLLFTSVNLSGYFMLGIIIISLVLIFYILPKFFDWLFK
jgi:hypothetical protein